jgi:tripartite ATP-independent transporter DctP family solute receptor
MKSSIIHLLAGCAVSALVLCSPAHAQVQDRTIRIGTTLSEQHPNGTGIRAMAACAAERSGGLLKIQGIYNAALGGDIEMSQATRAGTLDMFITSTSPMVGLEPKLGVFDLPFLFNNEDEATAVLDGAYGQMLADLMPPLGLVNVAFWENGFRHVTNSKHEIKTAADFQGIRLRVIQNNIFLDSFAALGANPIPMSWAEVFPALETRAIDGQENPIVTISDAQLADVQQYLSLTHHTYSALMVMYSKILWDQLSAEEQTIIMDCAKEGQTAERADIRQKGIDARSTLLDAGMTITEIDPAATEEMRTILQPVYDKYAGTIGADVVTGLTDAIAAVRKP